MSKASQLWLILVIAFAIPVLTGSGIVWWLEGPAFSDWLLELLPRLIPFGVLSMLSAFGVSAFTLKHYPELRENGPDTAFTREMFGGGVWAVVLFLVLNQIFYGWPGKMVHIMGILVTIFSGLGIGAGVVFLATLFSEIIYRRRNCQTTIRN